MSDWSGLIRKYRRANGLTQVALAEMLGAQQGTISRWEAGTHRPDLAIQQRLRDLMRRGVPVSDQLVLHRVRVSPSAITLRLRSGRQVAASPFAAAMHATPPTTLEGLDYARLHTESFDQQWRLAQRAGFFAGDVASVSGCGPWRPAGGGPVRYGWGTWCPIPLSDGEILLTNEFASMTEAEYLAVAPEDRFRIVSMDEILD